MTTTFEKPMGVLEAEARTHPVSMGVAQAEGLDLRKQSRANSATELPERPTWQPAESDAHDGRGGHTTIVTGSVLELDATITFDCPIREWSGTTEDLANMTDGAADGLARDYIGGLEGYEHDDADLCISADEQPRLIVQGGETRLMFAVTVKGLLFRD